MTAVWTWSLMVGGAAIGSLSQAKPMVLGSSLPAISTGRTSRGTYPFGNLEIDVTQTRTSTSPASGDCRAEVRIVQNGNIVSNRLFPKFDPAGNVYGLFVPKHQPSPDYFLIVKRGDRNGLTLVIDKSGKLTDLPGGRFWVVPEKSLLFSDAIRENNDGPVIFDLKTGRVLHSELPLRYFHWYRNGSALFYTVAHKNTEKNAEDRTRIFLYKQKENKFILQSVGPETWKRAQVIDRGFDPGTRKVSCGG